MSGGYGCALVCGGRRHGGPVRCGGCDGSCCKLLWWPVRQRLCCFDGDGGLTEAGIELRRVVAMGSKFRRNFAKFGNFGGGRKKNPKFCNTLIHVLYNCRLNFLLFILHIFVFNRCVVINHTNICLDLNVFLEKAYFMC